MLSASKNKRISPLATFAPSFLPLAGKPPFTTLQPKSFAIFVVLSFEKASATIIHNH